MVGVRTPARPASAHLIWCSCTGFSTTHRFGTPLSTRAPSHNTESWQVEVDVGVRVCLKMLRQGGLELSDLTVEFGDDGHGGAGGGREGGTDRGRGGQLIGAQRGADLSGTIGDVTLAPTTFERRLNRR